MYKYAAWFLLLLAACAGKVDGSGTSPCSLSPAQEVTRAPGLRFDDIAVASADGKSWVAFSHAEGLFVRSLNEAGAARGEPKRIGEPCRGGLAMTTGGGRTFVACSRPAESNEQAALVLMQLGADGQKLRERTLGSVGRDGAAVTLAATPTRLLIAYHDGSVGAYAARLVSVPLTGDLSDVTPQQTLLSDLTYAAGPPAIATRGEHWLAAFSETRYGNDGARTRLMLRSDTQSARTLRESLIVDPLPSVGWDEKSAWIAYRDRSLKNPKPELFAARLTSTLKLSGKPSAVGRANSDGPPSLFACGKQLIALLPREYASERYIGVHALDTNLANLGAGHQYYANSRDFVLARGTCAGGQALILAAERKAPAEPGAALVAMRFRCER